VAPPANVLHGCIVLKNNKIYIDFTFIYTEEKKLKIGMKIKPTELYTPLR